MNFTTQDLQEIIDSQDSISTAPWKHGSLSTYVVERDGKHYEVNIPFHPYEGPQIDCSINGYEVTPVERVVTDWVRVKTASAPVPVAPAAKEDKQ